MGIVTELEEHRVHQFCFDATLRIKAKIKEIDSLDDGSRIQGIVDFDVEVDLDNGGFVSVRECLSTDQLRAMKIKFIEHLEGRSNV